MGRSNEDTYCDTFEREGDAFGGAVRGVSKPYDVPGQ